MSRRRLRSKRRTSYKIKPKVIIIADGETEEDYINRLKSLNYFKNVNLKFEKGDENNFYTKLKEHLENKENIFLILDIDNVRDGAKYDKLKRLIEDEDYNVFYNNYSFETWLLNHKINFSTPIINSSQYNIHFARNFSIDSWNENKNKNNREKVMSQIEKENIESAIVNITNIKNNKWDVNPSSNMDDFINKIKGIK